jgi:thioesterase domain-containing protein
VTSADEQRWAGLSETKRALLRQLGVGGVRDVANLPAPPVGRQPGPAGAADAVRPEPADDPLVPLKAGADRAPLYCVHPISGSAYVYGALARSLADGQPVYGIEAPGFDNDRRPVATVEELSREYVEAIRRHRSAGIGCLLGWSMGGLVAFDMARRLAASGQPVPALILVDTRAPRPADLPAEHELLRHFVHDLLGLAGAAAPAVDAILAGWRERDGSGRFFRLVEQGGVLPAELDAESLERRFAVFRANTEAVIRYRPRYVHPGPVTLVRAAGSPPDLMLWDGLPGNLVEYTVPGNHYSMWTGRGLAMLGDIVQRCLDEVQQRGTRVGGRVRGG